MKRLFKTSKIALIAIVLASVLLFANNAYSQITVGDFPRLISVKLGAEATLHWSFKNANKVIIDGVDGSFAPLAEFSVFPKADTNYAIKAISDNDTVSIAIYIVILNEQKESFVKKGTVLTEPIFLGGSNTETNYFNGIKASDENSIPKYLKIMRTQIFKDTYIKAYFKCLILDKNGNYLTGLNLNKNIITHNFANDDTINSTPNNIKEINTIASQDRFNISIVLDNSAGSDSNNVIIESIKNYISGLSKNDYLTFSYFNQDFQDAIPLTNAEKSYLEMEKLKLPAPSGLNSLNKAVFKSINKFDVDKNDTKALVLITYGSDNSSIIITANDAANIANGINLPIYIIGVGNAVNSYQLRYLSGMTGGKYYQIQKDDLKTIYHVLNEITIAQKAYYEFNIQLSDKFNNQERVRTISDINLNNNIITDATSLILWAQIQYSPYQILSTCDKSDANVKSDYFDLYKSVADILKQNPSAIIELIGNGAGENTNDFDLALTKDRSEQAKQKLIEFGASPNQIKTRGDGISKPLYYMPIEDWQNEYNRRVEIRWLYPSMLPYELIAEKTQSEEQARKYVDFWEDKNLKAYFDRYVDKAGLIYRVKIWGYRTYEDADKASNELKKKYKKEFTVE